MPIPISPEPGSSENRAESAPSPHKPSPARSEKRHDLAMWMLLVSGFLWLGISGASFTQIGTDVERLVQQAIDKVESQGNQAEPNSVIQLRAHLNRRFYVIIGGSAALGVALIVAGILVKTVPGLALLATLTALAVTIVATAAYRYFTPDMAAGTWAWKTLTILALAKAVHSAIVYPRTQTAPPKKRAVFIPK